MPAYVIDRAPEFASIGPAEFPGKFSSEVLERDVLLHVFLTAEGKVADIDIIDSGGYEFDEAAIRTILHSRFRPARVGNLAVPSGAVIAFQFRSYYREEES